MRCRCGVIHMMCSVQWSKVKWQSEMSEWQPSKVRWQSEVNRWRALARAGAVDCFWSWAFERALPKSLSVAEAEIEIVEAAPNDLRSLCRTVVKDALRWSRRLLYRCENESECSYLAGLGNLELLSEQCCDFRALDVFLIRDALAHGLIAVRLPARIVFSKRNVLPEHLELIVVLAPQASTCAAGA